MAILLRFRRRATGGAAGAPSSLKTAEPAYNMTDGKLYVGYGDDGGGNATTIRAFGADNFIVNVPAGGTINQVLAKTSGVDGAVAWADPATGGSTYTASGNGIELTALNFSLNFSEIATGISLSNYALVGHTHVSADITSLDATKLTGTIDVARLPVLPGSNSVFASTNIASLSAPEQANINAGTIVTTSDGRRWVYNTGSKTVEASYVELADITPEWSVIANKPSFATVATTGAYSDLTGKPTLGTMSSQAASAVAITGGTIDGVTLDGGTF
jgi:hypothetical protein